MKYITFEHLSTGWLSTLEKFNYGWPSAEKKHWISRISRIC